MARKVRREPLLAWRALQVDVGGDDVELLELFEAADDKGRFAIAARCDRHHVDARLHVGHHRRELALPTRLYPGGLVQRGIDWQASYRRLYGPAAAGAGGGR